MPVDVDLVDDIAASIADIYREAETALIRLTAQQIENGIAKRRLRAVRDLRRGAQAIVTGLEADVQPAIREALAASYRHGWTAAVAEIPRQWFPKSGIAAAAIEALKLVTGFAFVEALATALFQDFGEVHGNILRNVDDAYRRVQAGAAARVLTGTQTRLEASQSAWQGLTDRGLTSFTDRAGRRWRLSTYVEMAARTNVHRAAATGQVDRLTSLGLDLVYVSNNAQECAKCRPFEGRILRTDDGPIGDLEVEHGLNDDEMVTVTVLATLDEARSRGFQHPNCRHHVSAYFPGVSKPPPQPTADPGGDVARQRQRALERRIRHYKEREIGALTPEAKVAAHKRVLAAQDTLRQHLDAHPFLKRLRYREQIGAGNIPPAGQNDPATGLGPDTQPPLDGGPAGPRPSTSRVAPEPAPSPNNRAPGTGQAELEPPDEPATRGRAPIPAPPGPEPQEVPPPAAPARPLLGDLVPREAADDRHSEITQELTRHLEGDYAGLTVEVGHIEIHDDFVSVHLGIRAGILRAGTIQRTFARDDDGTLYAGHDLLDLDPRWQGQGFAAAWNNYLESWYRDSGVRRIHLEANIDVGGYAWASQGYDWAGTWASAPILNMLRIRARDEADPSVRAEAAALLDRAEQLDPASPGYPTPREVSQLGRRPGQGRDDMWLGKLTLLGSRWDAVKWL